MHIPDGFLSAEICILTFIFAMLFLVWAWKKTRSFYSRFRAFAPLLAISSAFVFVAQMINFPIAYGTSGHLVGGTFLSLLLGPYAAILSMSIVLLMQALFFADGGIFTFGANVLNMAVIGGLSFFIVKFLANGHKGDVRFFLSVFVASWLSVVLGALSCGLQIGLSPVFSSAGGIAVTIPAMLFWHSLIGLGEAAITTTLTTQLYKLQLPILNGLASLRGFHHEKNIP
ncbi:MAG: energy-coupling factor ABC transporter permease [Candidatus Bathyarchaeia archaeon]